RTAFQKYEEFKTAAGEAEANKRFASQIGEFKKYEQYLQSELNDLFKEAGTSDDTKFNKSQKARYDAILAAQRDNLGDQRDSQNNAYLEALKLAETYEQKRIALRKRYAEAEKQLGENIT